MRTIRIGSGAGFSNDRVEPGIELLEKGQLDYFCLECLAERTIAIAQKEKNLDPNIGYNPYLAYRMKKILPRKFHFHDTGRRSPFTADSHIGNLKIW